MKTYPITARKNLGNLDYFPLTQADIFLTQIFKEIILIKPKKSHDIAGKIHFSENVMVFLYDFLYTFLRIFKERNFLQ